MSSSISTPAALSSNSRRASGTGWRVIEAQHRVSTLKITDSLAEQELLETLIEATKPAVPPECRHLHYLLATPFRYGAPYPHGSRFRRAGFTPGVFYASHHVETSIAEAAFWRLLFYAESPDTPWPANAGEYTAFAIHYATGRAIDLTQPPFEKGREAWMHPTRFEECQALAENARAANIDVIRYASVRDPQHRLNVALLSCRAFSKPAEIARQTWRIQFGGSGIRARCEMPKLSVHFERKAFAGDPRIAKIRWER
jgi:hypothetical protein